MILALTVRASAWLLQAASHDTLFTREIVQRGWFDQLAHVASGVLMILLLALVLLAFPAAWYVRHLLKRLTAAVEGLRTDLAPTLERTRGVMVNAEEISATVRRDVARLSETVGHFDGQLREIADIATERVREIDALVGAVQDEVEDIVVTTTSAARGLRAGARMLGRHRGRRTRLEPAAVEHEDAEAIAEHAASPENDDEPRPRGPRARQRHAT